MTRSIASFELHPQLEQDTIFLADWPLSQLRLMNDRQFPWFLLIPRINDVMETIDLTDADQHQLWRESAFLSRWMTAEYRPDKLNIAAIGNKVSQLHLHHIARFHTDPLWPDPVWGRLPAKPISNESITDLQRVFKGLSF